MKSRSLNPSPSLRLYMDWRRKFEIFNRHRRQDKLPEVSFKYWAYLHNVDLSGRTLVKNPYL